MEMDINDMCIYSRDNYNIYVMSCDPEKTSKVWYKWYQHISYYTNKNTSAKMNNCIVHCDTNGDININAALLCYASIRAITIDE